MVLFHPSSHGNKLKRGIKTVLLYCLQIGKRQTRVSLMAAEKLPFSPPMESAYRPSATDSVSIEHSYSLEPESSKLKRMFNEMRTELQETKQQLANSLRREKRAKQSLASLFTELKEEKSMSKEASRMLESYKGIKIVLGYYAPLYVNGL
ncbi:THAP domain containing [Mactra antiquata]